MVLFIMMQVILTFEPVGENIFSVTIQIKAIQQYFPVALFIMLHKVIPTFLSLVLMKS